MAGTLNIYVVYDHPADHPNHWAARRWEVDHGEQRVGLAFFLGDTLDLACAGSRQTLTTTR